MYLMGWVGFDFWLLVSVFNCDARFGCNLVGSCLVLFSLFVTGDGWFGFGWLVALNDWPCALIWCYFVRCCCGLVILLFGIVYFVVWWYCVRLARRSVLLVAVCLVWVGLC